jgi:hypothetical protein
MTRRKAVLASLIGGVVILVYGISKTIVPSYASHCVYQYDKDGHAIIGSCRSVTDVQSWTLDPGHFDPRYIGLAVIASIVTFLLIAALRAAWRSYR